MSGVGGSREKLSRLQELLERVQMRASAARAHGATNGGHAEASHAASTPAAAYEAPADEAPAHEAPAAQTSPPPAAYNERDAEMSAAPPTPAFASAPPEAEQDYDINTDSEVEVSSEVVEVDIDIDEPMPLESGAQPVAQQTMPPEDLLEEVEEQPMATQPSVRPPAESHEEIAHAAPPANEIEEPTPSSSRRPIAAEEASVEEAYAAESSPRHTPPPESGKQVAAAPSAHPPSRKPSAPPPSLEGHTLIGGWREPGLGTPQISPTAGMSTGVRVPAPPGVGPGARSGGTEPPATVVQGAGAVAAQASGTRLTADVTRPDLASGGEVASFTGTPAIEKPKTLGELLDLTLGL